MFSALQVEPRKPMGGSNKETYWKPPAGQGLYSFFALIQYLAHKRAVPHNWDATWDQRNKQQLLKPVSYLPPRAPEK